MNEIDKKLNETYSMKVIISFALGYALYSVVDTAIFSQIQYFYENEILLDVWLYTLAFILYTIWNMVNDPLAGYICDRTTRFTKKWGKRFPWIVILAFPYCLVPLLIFSTAPASQSNELFIFAWLLISLCLLDTFLSFS